MMSGFGNSAGEASMDAVRDVVIHFLVLEIPFQGKEALAGTASVIVEVGSLFFREGREGCLGEGRLSSSGACNSI